MLDKGREYYLQVNIGFSIATISGSKFSEVYDNYLKSVFDTTKVQTIPLTKGDIISVNFFEVDSDHYLFLRSLIKSEGDVVEYNRETLLTSGFVANNLLSEKSESGYEYCWIFKDVSHIYLRDKKLENLLC